MSSFETNRWPGWSRIVATHVLLLAVNVSIWVVFAETGDRPGTAILGLYRERWFLLNCLVTYISVWIGILFLIGLSRRRLFQVLAVHLGLGATFLLLEALAFVGVVDFREMGQAYVVRSDLGLRRVSRPLQYFEGVAKPDLARWMGVEADDLPYYFQTDRWGLRNAQEKGDPAVFCLGDSILVAGLLPLESIFTERLESIIKVPVLNVSESGYAPQESFLRLESMGIELRRKVIVHFIFEGNDLDGSQAWRNWRQERTQWPQSGALKRLLQFLHFPRLGVRPEERYGLYVNSDREEVKVYFLYDTSKIKQSFLELPILRTFFAETKRKVEMNGGIYSIAFVPTKITVLHEFCYWPSESNSKVKSMSTRGRSGFGDELKRICRELRIPFQDVTPALKSKAEVGILPYFSKDTHMNSIGHETMASALAGWIRDLTAQAKTSDSKGSSAGETETLRADSIYSRFGRRSPTLLQGEIQNQPR